MLSPTPLKRLGLAMGLPALAGLAIAWLAAAGAFAHPTVQVAGPALIVVAVPAFWIWIAWSVAHAGGWHDLAAAYPLTGSPPAEHRWTFQSAQMSLTHFRNSLHFAADARGLYIWPWLFFRAGNPPLFVPWGDITASKGKLLWVPAVTLRFARAPEVTVVIRKSLADKILGAVGQRWRAA